MNFMNVFYLILYIQNIIISTYNQYKNSLMRYFIFFLSPLPFLPPTRSSISWVYTLSQPHFEYSVITCDQWLPNWAAQVQIIQISELSYLTTETFKVDCIFKLSLDPQFSPQNVFLHRFFVFISMYSLVSCQTFLKTGLLIYNLYTIKFTNLKVYTLMIFSVFTKLYNNHHNLILTHLNTPKRNTNLLNSHSLYLFL